jgi:hypothetical protein
MSFRCYLVFSIFFCAILISACQSPETTATTLIDDVDIQFRELYYSLGGAEIFGPPISPKFIKTGREYQYTAAALFVYDPSLPREQQKYLAPIGRELDLTTQSSHQDAVEVSLFPGFQALYTQLGGENIVGGPLTNLQYNQEKQRFEQYFENLGFYQSADTTSNQVHLLHYGAWFCAKQCDFTSPSNSEIALTSTTMQPFIEAINSLDPTLIGRPLTQPHIAPDGNIEQIFHKVVLFTSPEDPDKIYLRPTPAMLGIPLDRGGDHTVPDHLRSYLEQLGGQELAGPATTPYRQKSKELFQQCFTNLCLNYFQNRPEGGKIEPMALGQLYKEKFYQESAHSIDYSRTYALQIWEKEPIVGPNTPQTVGVSISADGRAMKNITPTLILKLPGEINITYTFPATQENGQTILELNPIAAPHGTVISYDVCISPADADPSCASESFIIWGNP